MIIYLSFIDTKHLSINFWTLGIKNKMESRYISTILPIPTALCLDRRVELRWKKLNIDEEFLFWLSGFTAGEGNFSITLDRGYIRFRFKINLHIDDLQVINIIKSSKLKIGKIIVEENRSSCAFVVQSFSEWGEKMLYALYS